MKYNLSYCIALLTSLFILNLQAQSFNGPDFNGDGNSDLAHIWDEDGSLSANVYLSSGNSFAENKWIDQTGTYAQTQRWFYGDFNGDGNSDMATLYDDGGQMSCDVYISDGSSFSAFSWAAQSGPFLYSDKWFVGDFNADGSSDLARVYQVATSRSIDIFLSNGTGFDAPATWSSLQGSFEANDVWLTGDFDADGDTDFAVIEDDSDVRITAHLSNGNGAFGNSTWLNNLGPRISAMKFMTGDFTGDGMTDIAALWDDDGFVSVDAYSSTGVNFFSEPWVIQDGVFERDHRWFLGDFNGDDITDIARLWDDDGQLSIEAYESDGFFLNPRMLLTQGRDYRDQEVYTVGDYNGDGNSDIAVAWGDASNWHTDVVMSDSAGVAPSTVVAFSTNPLTDYFDRHNLVYPILGDSFVRYSELSGATPPGADIQAVLSAGNHLQLVKNGIYNVNLTLQYHADYQRIRTHDAMFISDYAIIRMQKDLGDYDTLIDGNRFDYTHLENVTVDGNKYILGPRERPEGQGQGAMVWFNYSEGVWVRRCVFYNTRVWSTLHFQGSGDSNSHIAEYNYILSAGVDPRGNGRALNEFTINANPTWGDGISVSAPYTEVSHNFIMDCTDVGIVIFDGYLNIHDNLIVNYSRSNHAGMHTSVGDDDLIGTSNELDNQTLPLYDFQEIQIKNNRILAEGARIMIGIGLGERMWGAASKKAFEFAGGDISGNVLGGGAFGYGYVMNYLQNFNATGNIVDGTFVASGRGEGSGGTIDWAPASGFIWDEVNADDGVTLQPEFSITDQSQHEILDYLWHHGKPTTAFGYYYYPYMQPEAEAMVYSSYWEMLGRAPTAGELSTGADTFMNDDLQTGDDFKRWIMTQSEFINRFGNMPQADLHNFRTGRWRDRIMAHDELEMIVTGNYPNPSAVYDNSYADLEYSLTGANANITAISPSLPTYMQQGDIVNVNITIQNTGTIPWDNTSSNPQKFALASIGDNSTFGSTRFYIPDGTTISPGQSYIFNVDIIAPPVAWNAPDGIPATTFFPYDFRMIKEASGYFGETISGHLGGTHQIEVENAEEPPPFPEYGAIFISQELQGDPQINGIKPGAQFMVSITMKNSGNYTSLPWTKNGGFNLGSENPRDNHTWGGNRISLDDTLSVGYGETVTFTTMRTAPAVEGTYDFQWMMLGNGWFGQKTPNLQITVDSNAPDISIDDSSFVSIDLPTQILQGDSFTADITFENTGDTTWTPETNFKLGNIETFFDRTDEYGPILSSEFGDENPGEGAEGAFDNDANTNFLTRHASSYIDLEFAGGNQYAIESYGITPSSDLGPGPELLSNSDMEGSGGWSLVSDFSYVTEEVYAGSRSLRARRTTIGGSGNTTQTITNLKDDTDYQLSFWIYKSSTNDGKFTIDTSDIWDNVADAQWVNSGDPDAWSYRTTIFNTGIVDEGKTANPGQLTLRLRVRDFQGLVYVDNVSCVEVDAGGGASDPRSWTLSGSNDGSNWTTLDTRSNIDFPTRGGRQEYTIASPASYSHYRFDATNNSGSVLRFAELDLMTAVTDNFWTGLNRVEMAPGSSVPPGSNYTFQVNLTAPNELGDYDFLTRMLKEDVSGQGWFGDYSPSQVVTVTDVPPPFNDAVFVSQAGIPTTIQPGAKFVASLQFQNTGNTTWSMGAPDGAFELISQNLPGNSTWGLNRVQMPAADSVLPGQTYTFQVVATAPALSVPGTPENFNFQWKMLQDGIGEFGLESTNVSILVDDAAPVWPFDDASFVSQVIPASVSPGEVFEVRMTFTNTGTTTWSQAGTYQLGNDNTTDWGLSLIDMDAVTTVAPGQNYEFVADLTAPSVNGNYYSRWRPNVPGRGRFGGQSLNALVVVNPNQLPSWDSSPVSLSIMMGGSGSIDGLLDLNNHATDDDVLTFSKVSYNGGPVGDGSWLTISPNGQLSGTVPDVNTLGSYVFTVSLNDGNFAPINNQLEINVASGRWFLGYPATEANDPDVLGFWNMNTGNFGTASGQLDPVLQDAAGGGVDAVTIYPDPGAGKFGDGIYKLSSGGDRDRYIVSGSGGLGDPYFPASADPSLTVDCWFKSDSNGTRRTILDTHKNNGHDGYRLVIANGSPQFIIEVNSTEYIVTGTSVVATNEWNHIAGTWDADTDTMRVYLNGDLEAAAVFPGVVLLDNDVNPLTLGTLANGTDRFSGWIDEVRVCDIAIPFIFPTDFPVWDQIGIEIVGVGGDPVADDLNNYITDNNSLSFLKISYDGGPDGGDGSWLSIAPNGTLSGTMPAVSGTYTFTVQADDGSYDPVTTPLQLSVVNDTWDQEYNGSHPNTVKVWHMSSADQDDTGLIDGQINMTNLTGGNIASAGKFGTALQNSLISTWAEVNGTSLRDDVYFPTGEKPSITVEMWVNVADTSASSSIVHNRSTGGYEMYMVGGGKIRWIVRSMSQVNYTVESDGFDITAGTWHHLAGTYNAVTQTSRLYIDGVERGSLQIPGFILEDAKDTISISLMNDTSRTRGVVGQVDELRISDTAYHYVALAPTDPYELWKLAHGITDDNGDADGDGVANFMEFSLGGDPNVADTDTVAPVAVENGSNIDFSFYRGDASVNFTVEKSTDLLSWSDYAVNPGSADSNVVVSVPDTEMVNGKLFLRLKTDKP